LEFEHVTFPPNSVTIILNNGIISMLFNMRFYIIIKN
jgi:hypothetical protein